MKKDFFVYGWPMEFNSLLDKISPVLRKIARRHSSYGKASLEDDLYQEMCLHLWNNFRTGLPIGFNYSYAIKSCQFHLLNYLRKERIKARLVSLEQCINEEGQTLKELIPDTSEPLGRSLERSISIDDILNNGFSPREKEVFSLLLTGLTAREAGKRLGISHVMVLKCKKAIAKKWQKKDS